MGCALTSGSHCDNSIVGHSVGTQRVGELVSKSKTTTYMVSE